MKKNFSLFFALLCSTMLFAQTITVDWAELGRRADDNNGVYGEAVAIDPDKNVVSGGYYYGQLASAIEFDTQSISGYQTGALISHGYFVKYNETGTAQWVRRLGNISGHAKVNGLACDDTGNIYVSGEFSQTCRFGCPNTGNCSGLGTALVSSSGYDGFLAKYDSDGNLIWVKQMVGASSSVYSKRIKYGNNSKSIFVTGTFSGAAVFGEGGAQVNLTAAGSNDVFVACYDQNGVLVWVRQGSGTSWSSTNDIGLDSNDNLYFGGQFGGQLTFGSTTLTATGGGTPVNPYIVKYNSSGTFQWAKSFSSTTNVNVYGVAVEDDGTVYFGGSFSDQLTIGTTTLTSTYGNSLAYLAKLNSTGTVQWAKKTGTLPDATGWSDCKALGAKSSDGFYSFGMYSDDCDFDGNTISDYGTTNYNVWYAEWDGDGNLIKIDRAAGTNSDYANDMVSDKSGSAFISGDSFAYNASHPTLTYTCNWGAITLYPNRTSAVTAKLSFCTPVTITSQPTPASATICQGNTQTYSVTCSGTTPISYQWYDGGGAISGATNSSYVASASGSYYCIVTNACGTETSNSVTLTVNTNVGITSATAAASPICINETTNITANGVTGTGATLTWWTGAGGTGSNFGSSNPLNVSPGTYYARVTGTCGSPVEASVTVASDPLPTASAGSSQNICVNETATVSGASAANGTIAWTENGAGSITSGSTTLTPVYTPAASDAGTSVTLTMTVSSNNNCSGETAQAFYTVNVDPLPTASAGGSQNICVNETATVSGASAANGTIAWTENGAGSITSGSTTLTPVYTPAAGDAGTSVTLTMTVSSNNNCSGETAQAFYTVNVDPLPTASAGGSQNICVNETATVSGASAANGTIAWTENGAGSITSGSTTLTPVYTPAASDAGTSVTLTMTVSSNNNCSGETAQAFYTVNVDPLPTASAGGSQNICVNETATVSGASAANGTIAWTENGAGSITSGSTTLTPVYTPAAGDAGTSVTLTMTVSSNNNCSGETAQAFYTVNVDPLPTASAGGSQNICVNETATVSGASATNGTIAWTENGAGSITSGSTTLTPTYTPAVADEGNTVTLTMTVTSDNNCSGETAQATYTVDVLSSPIAPTAGFPSDNDFCEDDAGNIDLIVSGGGTGTVHWFDDACGGNEIGTGNPLTIATPTINTTYFARYESSCGVSDCFSFDVTVVEPPIAPIKAESDINDICADHSGNIELTVDGGSGDEVQWFTGSCGGSSIGTGDPLVIPSPDVTTTYYARWANSCGESACVEHTVTVIQLPTDPTSATSDMTDFCSDDANNMALELFGGSGDEVYWYTELCGGTFVGNGSPLSIETPTTTTTYYGRWENSCGISSCEQVTVNVIEAPEAPTSIVPSSNNICEDDPGTIDLAAVNGSGTTLHWYTGSCEGTEIGTGNPLTIDSPTLTTEYFAAWENACGISTCTSVTINVIDAPTDPTEAQVDISEVCADDAGNIELTLVGGAGSTVEWYSGSCGGVPVGTGNPLSIESPTVSTTYYGRYESSCGNSACSSVEVIVNPLPLAPTEAFVDRTDFCADDAGEIELSVNGGSGDELIWYAESCAGTQVGIGNPLVIESPTSTTTYYALWSNGCGVSSCQFITVNVLETPEAPTSITPSANNICVDDPGTIDLAAVGGTGTTLRWYTGSCGGTEIGGSNPLTIDSPTEDTEYFVSYENGCGVSDCNSILINVIDEPADPTEAQADITEVCFDDDGDITLTLIGGEGPTVEWYSGSCGGTPVGTGNPLTIESPTVTTIYYGRYESSCGISACVSIEIKVNQIPEPPVSAEVDVNDLCSNDDGQIELSVTGGDGQDVYWYTESCGTTLVGNGNPLIIESPEATTTYYGRWENACGASVCQNVTVNIIPSADATINSTGPFCLTSSPTVVTAAQVGGTWNGDGINETTGLFEPSVAGVGDHIITYTITGTCGDTDQTTITVLDNFDATIDEVDEMCENASLITLNAATDGGTWNGDGITDADNGIFDPSVAGAGSHTITYEYTGTCGGFDDVIIVVNAAADATITPVGPFCEDANPVVVTAAETGGTWSGTAIIPTTGFFDPEIAGIGDHLITYTIDGDCGDTDQITISVIEYFDATITSGLDFCYRDSSNILTANTAGGTWQGAGIEIINDTANLVFTSIGPGNYEIIYHYDGLCGDADTVTITIHPDVDPTITAVDTLTNEDEPVQLVAANDGGIWDGFFVDEFGVFSPTEAGVALHQVIYTIEGVCGDSDTISIVVIDAPIADLLVPTVITPDNDGYNDRWRIQGIEAYEKVSIKIFTRWGDEVFVFDGTGYQYANNLNQWEGRRNDKNLPTGSYVYILILNDDNTYKGTISLIR